MRRLLLFAIVMAAAPGVLTAQTVDSSALQQLRPLIGSWEGTGWQMTAAGQRSESRVTERAELRLGGAAILVEGEGRTDEKVVHSALGVILYDAPSASHRMRAFRADGHMVDAVLEVGDRTFRWGFDDPRAGRIRFTARFTSEVWEEIGEVSRDGGATWQQFMGMTLRRAR